MNDGRDASGGRSPDVRSAAQMSGLVPRIGTLFTRIPRHAAHTPLSDALSRTLHVATVAACAA